MIFWTGKGEMVIIYMPRKPTPYGIELKTVACAEGKVMLFAEAVEGKEVDATKKYRDITTATTATTLRMMEAWAGTGRTAIMDAWFGSCNTAEHLQDVLGLHCILAVKTGHRGFPKQAMIDKIKGERFSSAFMKIDVQLDKGVTTFFAGAHMDKKPMLLIATCGTSLPGKEVKRYRREYVDQAITRTTYVVAQPNMHDLYRSNFNAVDLFNRSCFGPYSLQFAVHTKSWVRRMFLALLGMCETNAMNAYMHTTKTTVTRFEWLLKLSEALINNPWYESDAHEVPEPSTRRSGVCGNQVYNLHRQKCAACAKLTQWECGCGVALCRAGSSAGNPLGPCYFEHLMARLGVV
jgi:hypothetical protein